MQRFMILASQIVINHKKNIETYLPDAFPFLSTFLVDNIDTDFDDVDQQDSFDYSCKNMPNFYEHFV